MVLSLVFSIVIEYGVDVTLHLFLLLVEVHDDVVILFFLLEICGFNALDLLSELPKFLDLWSQLLLSVFDFFLDLSYSFGDLLQGLVLLIVEHFLHVGDALDLVFDLCVARDTLLSFKIFHEVT